jgi:hypothetical protein
LHVWSPVSRIVEDGYGVDWSIGKVEVSLGIIRRCIPILAEEVQTGHITYPRYTFLLFCYSVQWPDANRRQMSYSIFNIVSTGRYALPIPCQNIYWNDDVSEPITSTTTFSSEFKSGWRTHLCAIRRHISSTPPRTIIGLSAYRSR